MLKKNSYLFVYKIPEIIQKKKTKIISGCKPDCECLCHEQKSVTEVAVDMALLTANANQEIFV